MPLKSNLIDTSFLDDAQGTCLRQDCTSLHFYYFKYTHLPIKNQTK